MDITVLSRAEAERKEFHSGDWVISINERMDDLAQLSNPQQTLRLWFADVDTGGEHAMTEYEAGRILEFTKKAASHHKRLWVHCRAGISRSAGVADALDAIGVANWTNKGEKAHIVGVGYQSKFHPNAHVSALIKRVAWTSENGD